MQAQAAKNSSVAKQVCTDDEEEVTAEDAATLIEDENDDEYVDSRNNDAAENNDDSNCFRWIHANILLLLDTYKDLEGRQYDGKMSQKKFWDLVATKLQEKGFHVSGLQCKSKVNGMKKTFKNVKDHNGKTGNGRKTWTYFNIMEEMFASKPWMTPIKTLDSGVTLSSSTTPSIDLDIIDPLNSPSTSSETPVRQTKKAKITDDSINRLIDRLEKNAEERKRMHNENLQRQDKLLDLLSKLVEK